MSGANDRTAGIEAPADDSDASPPPDPEPSAVHPTQRRDAATDVINVLSFDALDARLQHLPTTPGIDVGLGPVHVSPDAGQTCPSPVVSTATTAESKRDIPNDQLVTSMKAVTIDDSADSVQGSPGSTTEESNLQDDDGSAVFPVAQLNHLHTLVSKPEWVVPVLPSGELPLLLKVAIKMAEKGADKEDEDCKRFINDDLPSCFTKLMSDDAVKDWKLEIQKAIYNCSMMLIELIVLKLQDDCLPLLESLSLLFDPKVRYHHVNAAAKASDNMSLMNAGGAEGAVEPYARSAGFSQKGWLVDFINKFGSLGGFEKLASRFENEESPSMSLQLAVTLIKPFGFCCQFITDEILEEYVIPCAKKAFEYARKLSDEEIKKECGKMAEENPLSALVVYCRTLLGRHSMQHQKTLEQLNVFRLTVLLKLLKLSSFSGKMNALAEIHTIIGGDEGLSGERVAGWVNEVQLIENLLKENMHQPLYVDRLERILRFMIKENALRSSTLDAVWAACQEGKHDAVVKNVHGLLAKLAWDFTPQQLDYLFDRFQNSYRGASPKEREHLLELMRRLAEDDKQGVMAGKVLELLWSLAHSPDMNMETLDRALNAHLKILDYSCSSERDKLKLHFIEACIREIGTPGAHTVNAEGNLIPGPSTPHLNWVIPALKHMRDICKLYHEQGYATRAYPHFASRHDLLNHLQNRYNVVAMVTDNLLHYMNQAREMARTAGSELSPTCLLIDNKYAHDEQIVDRLSFLRFLLTDGQLWLCELQASQIWEAVVCNPVFTSDRDLGFRWFAKLMGEEADIAPEVIKPFFESHILRLDVSHLTTLGLRCFEKFFKRVNEIEKRLVIRRKSVHLNQYDIYGSEYLWRVILHGGAEVAQEAIGLLVSVYGSPSSALRRNLAPLHEDFINTCREHLKVNYDTVSVLEADKDSLNKIRQSCTKMTRILNSQYEYVLAHAQPRPDLIPEDVPLPEEALPLFHSFYGRETTIFIRFEKIGSDDVPMVVHSNMTLSVLRKEILSLYNSNQPALLKARAALPPTAQPVIDMTLLDWPNPADGWRSLDSLGVADNSVIVAKPVFQGEPAAKTADQLPAAAAGLTPGQSGPGTKAPSSQYRTHEVFGAGRQLNGKYYSSESSSDSSLITPPPVDEAREGKAVEEVVSPPMLTTQMSNGAGEILSGKRLDLEFLLKLSDLACKVKAQELRAYARAMITLIPPCPAIVEDIRSVCRDYQPRASTEDRSPGLENVFFVNSPSEVLYNLQIVYTLLMPTDLCTREDVSAITTFRANFLANGGLALSLGMLVQNNFIPNADPDTKVTALVWVLRIIQFCLTAHLFVQQNVTHKNLLERLGPVWQQTLHPPSILDATEKSKETVLDVTHFAAVIKLVWAAAAGQRTQYSSSVDDIHALHSKLWAEESGRESEDSEQAPTAGGSAEGALAIDQSADDQAMVETGLTVLSLCCHLKPELLDSPTLSQSFLMDLVFSSERYMRQAATDQLYQLVTECDAERQSSRCTRFMNMLMTVLDTLAPSRPCSEYFLLLKRLTKWSISAGYTSMEESLRMLDAEVAWLERAREYTASKLESFPNEPLLCGHLELSTQLVMQLPRRQKAFYGTDSNGRSLVRYLLDDFALPASRMYVQMRMAKPAGAGSGGSSGHHQGAVVGPLPRSQTELPLASEPSSTEAGGSGVGTCVPGQDPTSLTRSATTNLAASSHCIPVCGGPISLAAAYDLLVTLCIGCPENLQAVVERLVQMFYNDTSDGLTEWEYLPPVGLRPSNGFVGLKNGGATCYMNSVLQQLFMIDCIREHVLSVNAGPVIPGDSVEQGPSDLEAYNIGIVRHLQLIFGHLLGSQLQFYTPRHFWKFFRYQNEAINLREQHDAVEFLDHIVDSLDEAFKALKVPTLSQTALAGQLSDQKVCKDCPHRYSKDAQFTYLSVDVKNANKLETALEDYVRGELLEGPDAYYCENCGVKVDAVKRLCIKSLPSILTIQLKRFDYDWERDMPVKFNDYFEFPREFSMEPYTVHGLARKEGELVAVEDIAPIPRHDCTYRLVGIVVHSGMASGGHYYSYIRTVPPGSGQQKGLQWFKFDDGDVSPVPKMDEDEELKNLCFGGESTFYDQMVKTAGIRRQKRWFNAYILFYEQISSSKVLADQLSQISIGIKLRDMPTGVEDAVRLQNMQILHQRQQFSTEYFAFTKRLCHANVPVLQQQRSELEPNEAIKVAELSIGLASGFLFMTGLHAKKSLRGNMQDWLEILNQWFKLCPEARWKFIRNQLFGQTHRFSRYILECPSQDIRVFFCRLLAFLALHSKADKVSALWPSTDASQAGSSVSNLILSNVLTLLLKEVADWGRHLTQFFSMFHYYANFGPDERAQLLALDVPYKFICLAIEEGPGPPVRYQYVDFSRLFGTVSVLVRSCDVSHLCRTSDGSPVPPNPYDFQISSIALPSHLADMLYGRQHAYVKKFIEDMPKLGENVLLLMFMCWENRDFSHIVLHEIFVHVSRVLVQEVKPLLDLLLSLLIIQDSWQSTRIQGVLKGVEQAGQTAECVGLFDMMLRARHTAPKRSYLLLKMLTNLFAGCPAAATFLAQSGHLRRRWTQAVRWLNGELEQKPPAHYYGNWPNTAYSNESSHAFYLERSVSAQSTLEKAAEVLQTHCADEVEATAGGGQVDASDEEDFSPAPPLSPTLSESSLQGSSLNFRGLPVITPGHPPPPDYETVMKCSTAAPASLSFWRSGLAASEPHSPSHSPEQTLGRMVPKSRSAGSSFSEHPDEPVSSPVPASPPSPSGPPSPISPDDSEPSRGLKDDGTVN